MERKGQVLWMVSNKQLDNWLRDPEGEEDQRVVARAPPMVPVTCHRGEVECEKLTEENFRVNYQSELSSIQHH